MSHSTVRSLWQIYSRYGLISVTRDCSKSNHSLLSLQRLSYPLADQGPLKFKSTLSRRAIRVHDPLKKVTEQSPDARANPLQELQRQTQGRSDQNVSTSVFNLAMGEVMMSNSSKRIAVEGNRLVEEALKAGLKLEKLFLLRTLKELSPPLNYLLEFETTSSAKRKECPEIHRVNLKSMQTWSSVTTPPGIIGIFKKPRFEEMKITNLENVNTIRFPLTVICDNIREPGNLGSILRSAASAGCAQVMLTKGCVDPWNMKVLRGACGAHYNIPVLSDVDERLLETLLAKQCLGKDTDESKKVAVIMADNNIEDPRFNSPSESYWNVDFANFRHIFIVIGGETTGICNNIIQIVKSFSEKDLIVPLRLRIPLANNMESLNAANAFGIITFEVIRQLYVNNVQN